MPQPPERILMIRPSALGDVARTVPALASLRAAYPDARIDWVVEQGFEPVINRHPALSNAIPFPKKAVKEGLRRLDARPLQAFLASLREARYDQVFDLQGLARSALMARATHAPDRFGLRDAREFGWLAYNRRADAGLDTHTVERMLAVVAASGVPPLPDMRLYSDPAAREWARSLPWTAGPFAVLAPTSRWPGKQWPDVRFASLARYLSSRGVAVALVGAVSERNQVLPAIQESLATTNIHDLVGATTLPQLMALLEASSLVVANDSAALHIAVGFSRPLVALFGPTRVNRVGPYRREADVIQHVTPRDTMDHKDASQGAALMDRITLGEVCQYCEARLHLSRSSSQTPS